MPNQQCETTEVTDIRHGYDRVRTKYLGWFSRIFPGVCFPRVSRHVKVLVFLTQSTLPSWHVTEHCTNYCVILHLTYLL